MIRAFSEFTAKLGIAAELLLFLWRRKLWWMIPMVAVLLAFGVVIATGGASGAGPFLYTLF